MNILNRRNYQSLHRITKTILFLLCTSEDYFVKPLCDTNIVIH
jgi:hypothetical protein